MKIIETLCRKLPKTFLMSSKVRRAMVGICVVEHADGSKSVGIAAISEQHALFAKATNASPETLVLAAEIVYSHMPFITDEALSVALSIASEDTCCDEENFKITASRYLRQGMTISKVREGSKRTRSCTKTIEEIAQSLSNNGIASSNTPEALAA